MLVEVRIRWGVLFILIFIKSLSEECCRCRIREHSEVIIAICVITYLSLLIFKVQLLSRKVSKLLRREADHLAISILSRRLAHISD